MLHVETGEQITQYIYAMIIAHDIHKSFGDLKVLNGIDLHIPKGCIFGLAGRSGAGKSTFLRCINGIESYDRGELTVDNVDVKGLRKKKLRVFRSKIGMIFQNFSLLERLTVYDNVALPLRCWKAGQTHLDKKVKELLGLVGLTDKMTQRPRELSGGQKQRVAIARALSIDPHILLCDEATSALDPKTAQEILSLLRQINKDLNLTIVMVTHQVSVLTTACSEVAILENGKLDTQGPVKHIFEQKPHSLKNLLGEYQMLPRVSPRTLTLSIETKSFIVSSLTDELGTEVTLVKHPSASPSSHRPRRLIRIPEHELKIVTDYLNQNAIQWQMVTQPQTIPTQLF